MKPWEETWRGQLNKDCTWQELVVDQDGLGVVVAQGCGGSDEDDARMSLIAAAPDMARALLAVEWVTDHDDGLRCPVCGGYKPGPDYFEYIPVGHQNECFLEAALVKAGVVSADTQSEGADG